MSDESMCPFSGKTRKPTAPTNTTWWPEALNLKMLSPHSPTSNPLDPAFNYSGIRALRSDGHSFTFPDIDQFAAEMDDFARCIQEGTPSIVSGEEGLRDVRILMAIYRSARTGAPVDLTRT